MVNRWILVMKVDAKVMDVLLQLAVLHKRAEASRR